jgi:glycosyltransferase involved in cell wall biosynthesis
MKNLLIIKEFNKSIFFKNHLSEDWEILELREFVSQFNIIRHQRYHNLIYGYKYLEDKLLQFPIQLLSFFIKADKKFFLDDQGKIKKISFLNFLFIETPLFLGELIFDLLLIFFTWLGLIIFYFLPKKKEKFDKDFKNIIYLRTDNFRGLQQGGSFTHFRGVVKGFDKLGYKINYIGSGKIELPNLNFPQNIIDYPKKFNFPEIPEIYYNWRFIPKSFKIIKKEKPLFIYQRHSIFNVCGVMLSQLTEIPLILEYNGSESWVRQKWGGLLIFKNLCYFFENICLKKSDLICVVSQPIKDQLLKQGISGDKILVNYNGVDVDEFNPNTESSEIRKKYNLGEKIIVGSVSTFGVWHGMPILSQAVKSIIKKTEETEYKVHFLFIGEGVQKPECERIIQESGMKNYVTFCGTIPFTEIKKYLATCDILVASHIPNSDGTPFFGSPTKLFEYMAMSKGIVASDLDQIGEVLEHQKTAWLVKPGDINDLVYGIIKLIENKKLREELGKKVREEVSKKYTWEESVKKVIKAFDNL